MPERIEMNDHENCHHFLNELSEYVDGELDESLCHEIEKHLAHCEKCRIVVDTLKKTIFLYHETTETPELPSDVRSRLYRRLKLDQYMQDSEWGTEE